ncbi:MAG: hypothetical protein JWN04_556 [Myxococcaceae bacterium]|nr:hypothetical protein [Myxococcaceae bacterium]
MSSSSRPLAVVVQLSAREPSDAGLVQRVRSGVRSAEEALYARHVGRMLALCLRLLGDRDEAEDVLQESFLDAFEQLRELRDPSQFGRFVTGIAVLKVDALFRSRRTRRFVLARSLASGLRAGAGVRASTGHTFLRPQAELEPALRQQLAELDAALAKLRDRDRAAWSLHQVEGYSLEEVAGLMHRPLAIVKRRVGRAERSLRSSYIPANLPRLLDQSRPANARHLLNAFQARRAVRGRPSNLLSRSLRIGVGVLMVVALILLGAGRRKRHEALPLTMRDQRNLPSAMLTGRNYHAFDLSDGSRVTLAAGARVDVLDNSLHELVLALRQGRVRFDIQPHGPRAWRIESAGLSVEVVGTKFVMERGPHSVQVTVDEGAVVLRGDSVPERVQRLRKGQSFVAEAQP